MHKRFGRAVRPGIARAARWRVDGVAIGALALWVAAVCSTAGFADDGQARLHALLSARMQSFPGFDVLPAEDRPRALKCVVDAFLADIPEADAGRLADMFEKKIPADKELVMRWMVIERDDNPNRRTQVEARAAALCPDLKKILDRS